MRLEDFVAEAGRFCQTLPVGEIKRQLESGLPAAIVTRELCCGIRIGRAAKNLFQSFLTNGLEKRKELGYLNGVNIEL